MLIDSNYVRTFLALPPSERSYLRRLFKTYDQTKLAFPSYNARAAKYTAIEFTYENFYIETLNKLDRDLQREYEEEEECYTWLE